MGKATQLVSSKVRLNPFLQEQSQKLPASQPPNQNHIPTPPPTTGLPGLVGPSDGRRMKPPPWQQLIDSARAAGPAEAERGQMQGPVAVLVRDHLFLGPLSSEWLSHF